MIPIKQITTVEELYKSKGAPTGESIVDAVVDYVKRVKGHSAEDVAIYLDVNRRKLSGAFELLVGVPLSDFILEWRLMQAVDLLDDETLSVAEVARRTGFKSVNYLTGVFTRRLGTTPLAYRNGEVTRNGNYPFNRDAYARKKVLENAARLKARNSKTVPNKE